MENNLKLLHEQFEKNKGQFVIIYNEVLRFVCIAEDEMDYYYVLYDGRKLVWHSAVGSYIVLKDKIDDKDYNELVRMAKINHFDQENFMMPRTPEDREDYKKIAEAHKSDISSVSGNDKYLAPFCWDIN